jgi:hypothetical protein
MKSMLTLASPELSLLIGRSATKTDLIIGFASPNYLKMTIKSSPSEFDTFRPKRHLCVGYRATTSAINDSF